MRVGLGIRWQQCNVLLLLCLCMASAQAADTQPQMAFSHYTDTLYASGPIDADAGSRLKTFVGSNAITPGTVVALSSSGGSVIGGIRLGNAIRELGLRTNVFRYEGASTYRGEDGLAAPITFDKNESTDCVSACVYAYLGGVQRHLYAGSRIGIHQFHFPDTERSGTVNDAQILSAAIVAHLSKMGVNPTLFSATALFGKDEMRYLTRHEAEDFNLIDNGVKPKVRYQVSKGRPYPELLQESEDGEYRLGLLCNGTEVHIGASRGQKRRSVLDNEDDKVFFWMDGTPIFEMDAKKDTFYKSMDNAMLDKLFATRRVRIWTTADGWAWNGAQIIVDDWSQFSEYASECGR